MNILKIFGKRKSKFKTRPRDVPQGEAKWYDETSIFGGGGTWDVFKCHREPLAEMPEAALCKFAFSFRANATRITVSAEAIPAGAGLSKIATKVAGSPKNIASDKCRVIIEKSRWDCKQHVQDISLLKQLEEIMRRHGLYKWAGFRGAHEYHAAICEHFFMRAMFEDGLQLEATGSSEFPEGFFAPMKEIFGLFGIRV